MRLRKLLVLILVMRNYEQVLQWANKRDELPLLQTSRINQ